MLLSKHKLKFLTNNITKVSKLLNVSLSLTKKISEKRKMLKTFLVLKHISKSTGEMIRTWIRINFFPWRIQNTNPDDPHQNGS